MKKPQVDTISIHLKEGKKIFFASDFHLGSPNYKKSREREKKIVSWIEENTEEMGALFLLGDVFDYWFEYKHVVPKGFIRLFAAISRLTDSGIPVYFFCGNHDFWVRTFFQQELGLRVCKQNAKVIVNDTTNFYVGHGDGLGPDDMGYKFVKTILSSGLSRFFFAALHPWLGYILASGFSHRSRKADELKLDRQAYEKKKNENLMIFMQETLDVEPDINYFIFAHRHWPTKQEVFSSKSIPTNCYYLNTGDWIQYFSYGVFDGKDLTLRGEHTDKIF